VNRVDADRFTPRRQGAKKNISHDGTMGRRAIPARSANLILYAPAARKFV
jgi:hypothetical protein